MLGHIVKAGRTDMMCNWAFICVAKAEASSFESRVSILPDGLRAIEPGGSSMMAQDFSFIVFSRSVE